MGKQRQGCDSFYLSFEKKWSRGGVKSILAECSINSTQRFSPEHSIHSVFVVALASLMNGGPSSSSSLSASSSSWMAKSISLMEVREEKTAFWRSPSNQPLIPTSAGTPLSDDYIRQILCSKIPISFGCGSFEQYKQLIVASSDHYMSVPL